jgi:three-Cys-motif partner protein
LDGQRAQRLRQISAGRTDVTVYEGDCNDVLLAKVFPKCRYEEYRRALCLLDPYDLNPRWEVVRTAGSMKSIELFLNFMIMDANMNVLWKRPDMASKNQVQRMNAFWGDESWREIAYRKQPGLFGDIEEKAPNADIAQAYAERLRKAAGFKYVPEPLPMKNTKGAVIYYLFFASQNSTGDKIARFIFDKHRDRR